VLAAAVLVLAVFATLYVLALGNKNAFAGGSGGRAGAGRYGAALRPADQ
jgi:hypothetical protein